MKKNQVTIGNVYTAKVSGNLARVRITGENPNGGWDGLNIDTRRKVRIKTAGRLHRQIADPDAASLAPEAEGQPEVQDVSQEAASAAPEAQEAQPDTEQQETPLDNAEEEEDTDSNSDDATEETHLTKLSVPELQALYRKVIQRETSSSNKAYLVWKLREAKKGRIPIGPRTRRAAGEAGSMKVLPLRMEADLVKQLDEARERLGLQSRMELFRRSLHAFLLEAGEVRVAELFSSEA